MKFDIDSYNEDYYSYVIGLVFPLALFFFLPCPYFFYQCAMLACVSSTNCRRFLNNEKLCLFLFGLVGLFSETMNLLLHIQKLSTIRET